MEGSMRSYEANIRAMFAEFKVDIFRRLLDKPDNMGSRKALAGAGKNRWCMFEVSILGEDALQTQDNIYRMTFAEDGLRQYIKDWPLVERFMLGRLWEEAVSSQNDELFGLYQNISQLSATDDQIDFQMDNSLPVMNLTLQKGAVKASFFTTVTTLGTPLDLTTQELRMESLFPADEETKKMFHC